MKHFKLIAVSVVVLALTGAGRVQAQVHKTFQRTDLHGNTARTPYVTYEEFQSSELRSPEGQAELRNLLSVSSTEEVKRRLGDPESIKRREDPNDASFTVWLRYGENTTMKYHGFPDGTLGLTSVELHSSGWSMTVGGTELRPGASIDGLSSAVRKTVEPESSSKKEGRDGKETGAVYIADPKAGKSGGVEPLKNGMTQFNYQVDPKTKTITVVRLSRIPETPE